MAVSAAWGREFRLWHYTVSYSQLLFRSVDADASPKRIDVLFSNVEYMKLDVNYESFAVKELVWPDIPKPMEPPFKRPQYGKIFLINEGPDFVAATHCQWHEDDGDVRSPSKFGPLRRTD